MSPAPLAALLSSLSSGLSSGRPRVFAVAVTAALAVVLLAPTPARAQDNRYGTWQNPDQSAAPSGGEQTSLDRMIIELKRLVDSAERARAADQLFLSDLKALAARYERQVSMRLLFDDFADGNYTASPRWTIAAGEFWIERGFGLRSRVRADTAPATEGDSQRQTQREIARQLLGAMLQGAVQGSGGTINTTPPASPSMALLPATLPNAFALSARVTSWNRQGRFEVGVYQQGLSAAGYRVAYMPGGAPALELHKITMSGRTVIARATSLSALEDEKTHTLELTRAGEGTLTVNLDGRELMRVRDTGFNNPFSGVLVANTGSDVILHDISVLAAN